MGCDIHLLVQRRESDGAPWRTVTVDYECPECEGTGTKVYPRSPEPIACIDCRGTKRQWGYSARNYCVFGQLADVRNGVGFAGIDTGDRFEPIAEQRGLPDGVEADGVEGPWLGDHSFSWLTLAELLTYDIDRISRHRGVCSKTAWERWDGKGPPEDVCGDVWGAGVMIGTEEQARAGEAVTHVRISWPSTYREAGGQFWRHFVPALTKLGDPENVRIVFGFDS